MRKQHTKKGNQRRQKELERLYNGFQPETLEAQKSSTESKTVKPKKTDSLEENVFPYLRSDLIRMLVFMLFAVIILIAAGILFSDFSIAASLRETLGVNQIALSFPFL
jgi:hypothetical protein